MEEYKINKEKSFFFKISILIQIILMLLLFLDGKVHIPKNQLVGYTEISLSIIGTIALLMIFYFRKLGVFIYATVLIIGLIINPFKSDLLFSTFFFIGIGLTEIIPRWHLFK